MFAKNKPTKTLTFGENKEHHVVLQHLSKGVKDEYVAQLADLQLLLKDVDKTALEKNDLSSMPESVAAILKKINEIEYQKVAHAIKEWSASEPIEVETVKELDEETFNEIAKEVDAMNKLTEPQRKN